MCRSGDVPVITTYELNGMPSDTEQELPLGEAGSPEGEPDEGRGAA